MSAVLDSRAGALRAPVAFPPRPAPAEVLPFPCLMPLQQRSRYQSSGRGTGLAVVVGIHLLLAWALASGLAQHGVDVVLKPIEMAILSAAPPPIRPPPPPKVEKIVERPRAAALPPAYLPPPDVTPAPAPLAPTIASTQVEPPREPLVGLPSAAPPVPDKPAVVRQEVSLACPGYQAVLAQVMEEAIDRAGITGTVRTRLTVRGGQVVDVAFLAGPGDYTKYVQRAVKRMHCSAGGAEEGQVPLELNFAR